MSRYFYEDFIYSYENLLNKHDRLGDLPEEIQDEAVYIWLNKYTSWYTDIYPACFNGKSCDLMTEMLFGSKKTHSVLVKMLFNVMAEESSNTHRDDLYQSEALGYVDDKMHLDNFADEIRESIYLYLENSMEDEIYQQLADLKARDKYEHFEE